MYKKIDKILTDISIVFAMAFVLFLDDRVYLTDGNYTWDEFTSVFIVGVFVYTLIKMLGVEEVFLFWKDKSIIDENSF